MVASFRFIAGASAYEGLFGRPYSLANAVSWCPAGSPWALAAATAVLTMSL